MNNIEIYRICGFLSFALGWLGIILLLARWDRDKAKSISEHAAANKITYALMALLEPIILIFFVLFTVRWLAPTYKLSIVFSVCCIGAALGLLIAAWIPAVKGIKGRIHDMVAYGAAVLFMPTTLLLAVSAYVDTPVKIINYISFLLMFSIFMFFLFNKAAKNHHLYYQSAYILIFDIGLLSAALMR